MTLHPLDYFPHKGYTASRMAVLHGKLQVELNEKYVSHVLYTMKANLQLDTVPACFDYCI